MASNESHGNRGSFEIDADGERKLVAAMISQAIEDFVAPWREPPPSKQARGESRRDWLARCEKRHNHYVKKWRANRGSARWFLFDPKSAFERLCGALHLDPEVIRERVRRRLLDTQPREPRGFRPPPPEPDTDGAVRHQWTRIVP